MIFENIISLFLPKKPESASDTAASGSDTGMAKENYTKIEKVINKCNEEELAHSFQVAFNQGNLAMMEMLTEVGGYKPSPEMKNDKGVNLKQWMSEQAKGADEATRNLLANLDRRMETPALTLSSKALAQVSAIQSEMGQLMGGLSQSSLSLPTMQRSMGFGLAA